MQSQAAERFAEQRLARLSLKPGGSAGRMRQGDHIQLVIREPGPVRLSDDLDQLSPWQHLSDRQATHWNEELRAQDLHFGSQPARTVLDFAAVRHAVTAALRFAGKAAANRGDIDRPPKSRLVDSQALEPTEEGSPSCPCEGATERPLTRARGLAKEHDARNDGRSGDDWRRHRRASATLQESTPVSRKALVVARGGFGRHSSRLSRSGIGFSQKRREAIL